MKNDTTARRGDPPGRSAFGAPSPVLALDFIFKNSLEIVNMGRGNLPEVWRM
jgi:geranylgeranyl pyrophosphate synthase